MGWSRSNSDWKGCLDVTSPTTCTKQVQFWQVAQGPVLLNLQLSHVLKRWNSFLRPWWALGCVEVAGVPCAFWAV